MSISSLSHFANSFSPFAAPYATRMSRSRTVGLDTLAEGSQYALEQLQLSREAGGVAPNDPTAPLRSSSKDLSLYGDENQGQNDPNLQSALRASLSAGKPATPRDPLAEARSAIRKNSASAPVRRRISRACDQCNQLRTKCDGQNPCAHCIGMYQSWYIRPHSRAWY